MSDRPSNLTQLIKEHAQLQHEEGAPALGDHGERSRAIRQEIVEIYRPEDEK